MSSINKLIDLLKKALHVPQQNQKKIKYYSAPYEAAPQLVYLQKIKVPIIHIILSNDSDCIALGSPYFISSLEFGEDNSFKMFVRDKYVLYDNKNEQWEDQHYAMFHALMVTDFTDKVLLGSESIITSINNFIETNEDNRAHPMNNSMGIININQTDEPAGLQEFQCILVGKRIISFKTT